MAQGRVVEGRLDLGAYPQADARDGRFAEAYPRQPAGRRAGRCAAPRAARDPGQWQRHCTSV